MINRNEDSPGDFLRDIDRCINGKFLNVCVPWDRVDTCCGNGLRLGKTSVLAGPPGNGKTYFGLQICLEATKQKIEWAYLPLEMKCSEIMRRCMAIHIDSWGAISQEKQKNEALREYMLRPEIVAMMKVWKRSILENPRLPKFIENKIYCPDFPYETVIDWIAEESKRSQFIVIDPISMIDYDHGGKEWTGQQKFIQKVSGVAEHTGCHIMLIAHVAKRNKHKGEPAPLTGDDVQGSAAFSRFTDYLLMLDYHDEKESTIFSLPERTVTHKRTLYFAKTRFGHGTGSRIAMDFSDTGPKFVELGTIKRKE